MTDEQFQKIMAACQPVPLIMLQCGMPRSTQERANAAWEALGAELGFDHMTVRPVSEAPQTVFEAEPSNRASSEG